MPDYETLPLRCTTSIFIRLPAERRTAAHVARHLETGRRYVLPPKRSSADKSRYHAFEFTADGQSHRSESPCEFSSENARLDIRRRTPERNPDPREFQSLPRGAVVYNGAEKIEG